MNYFKDFYNAYHFLNEHKMVMSKIPGTLLEVNYFDRCLDIFVVKVNPATNEIDDNIIHNTKTAVWLEFGGIYSIDEETGNVTTTHDYDLDCGADTFEEAIIILANLVYEKYGTNAVPLNE